MIGQRSANALAGISLVEGGEQLDQPKSKIILDLSILLSQQLNT